MDVTPLNLSSCCDTMCSTNSSEVMSMPLSVRLDRKSERLLEETASILKTTRADVIKKSLSDFCGRVLFEKRKRPYVLLQDLLDRGGSGKGDLSTKGEEILRERFERKK